MGQSVGGLPLLDVLCFHAEHGQAVRRPVARRTLARIVPLPVEDHGDSRFTVEPLGSLERPAHTEGNHVHDNPFSLDHLRHVRGRSAIVLPLLHPCHVHHKPGAHSHAGPPVLPCLGIDDRHGHRAVRNRHNHQPRGRRMHLRGAARHLLARCLGFEHAAFVAAGGCCAFTPEHMRDHGRVQNQEAHRSRWGPLEGDRCQHPDREFLARVPDRYLCGCCGGASDDVVL
mmetsp:Transcript_134879/g.336571  ORF Transcript_134879/g.336571 Transcript_134879/m.336571 type:complete len:228 (+) Transcript_134879:672-1355(+)